MVYKSLLIRLLPVVFVAALLMAADAEPAKAQSFDNFDRDEFVESDEEFGPEGDGFEEAGPQDFTEGGKFIDEEAAPARRGITLRGRRTQLRVRSERELLPLNVAWGAGTGLLIGGWLALIENGTDRDTQRSIGLGVVLGGLLGMTVGLKTVIAPDAPRAALLHPYRPVTAEGPATLAAAAPIASPFQLAYTFRF